MFSITTETPKCKHINKNVKNTSLFWCAEQHQKISGSYQKKTPYKSNHGSGITGFCYKQNEDEIVYSVVISNKGYIFPLKQQWMHLIMTVLELLSSNIF